MTLASPPVPAVPPAPPRLPGPRDEWRPPPGRAVSGTAIMILAATLIGFLAWIGAGSRLYYDRAQHDAYADFRVALASAVAPTGPTNPYNAARLLTPGTSVAVLRIPELRLRAVVFEGTSGQVLRKGPGHLRDTPLPGQPGTSVIFGRQAAYGGPFAGLGSLNEGDQLTVMTGQGTSTYQVLDVRRAGDPLPPAVQPGQGALILVTADGTPFDPTGVLRIDATLVSRPFPAPTMVVSPASLSPGENILGTDPLAWVPLVLWGQCLLAAAAAAGWLWQRWGKWQTWIVAVPVVGFFAICVANEVALLLPNLT
ncbi:MAG TPA: sortase [Trebonia sp.]|nr:sortase [Trebonia sp.]